MNDQELKTMRLCCGLDTGSYSIAQPFLLGNRVYATDGRICGRVDRAVADEIGLDYMTEPASEGQNFPPADGLDWDAEYGDALHDVPACEATKKECRICKGKGHFAACYECDGSGYSECWECGHERECPECDGEGTLAGKKGKPCDECGGSGEVDEYQPAHIADGVCVGHLVSTKLRELGVQVRLNRAGALKAMRTDVGRVQILAMPSVFAEPVAKGGAA